MKSLPELICAYPPSSRKMARGENFGHGFMKNAAFILLAAFAFVINAALSQAALGAATTACDKDYYEALKARAWMEAQREVTQNQNIIYKPDSVLEYSCFDQHLGVLAAQAPGMFSGPDMHDALSNLVGGALQDYQTGSFNHASLGGKGEPIAKFPGDVKPGGYNCLTMNAVWSKAKCRDFSEDSHEGFLTFTQIQGQDPRQIPEAHKCGGDGRWAVMEQAAYKTAAQDDTKTYLDYLQHDSCGKFDPIETGIPISRPKSKDPKTKDYSEKVCIQPGCIYNAEQCVPNL